MPARRKRREEHEEHSNHERWLVSYADMMTLLMVLFIVMFAISQVDQRRFEMLKDGLAAGFGSSSSPFQGSEGTMSAEGLQPLQPIRPDAPSIGAGKSDVRTSTGRAATTDQRYAEAVKEVASLERLRRRIEHVLAAKHFLDDVSMKIDERGLSISLVSRHIVFKDDVADLSPRGQQVLDALAPVIRSLPNQIDVDGHTNQVKVKPKYYPTDWELSSARAVTVLRYLHERGGVSARRMSAVAYGHERPLRDPALPGAAALNKRVDLVVLSAAPEAARKLFQTVLRDHHNHTGQGT